MQSPYKTKFMQLSFSVSLWSVSSQEQDLGTDFHSNHGTACKSRIGPLVFIGSKIGIPSDTYRKQSFMDLRKLAKMNQIPKVLE